MRAGLCPARLFAFCNAPCGGRCPHRPASAILHRTSCRGGRPCPPVHAAADKSKIDASLRASAHTCPASYRGVCRAHVPCAHAGVAIPWIFQESSREQLRFSIALLSSPTFKTTCTAQPHTPPPFSHIKRRAEERIPRPCVSMSKKPPRPAALSSFLNLISSETCLMERERSFLPLSLYPRCSIMELHFIVF